MFGTFLTDVGAQAAAIGAILGALIVTATFAQKSFSGVDRVFDWLQARRMAALARSVRPVIEGAVTPLAQALQAHLTEEESLIDSFKNEVVGRLDAWRAEQEAQFDAVWDALTKIDPTVDRRKPT